jgi:hypothetical protein
VSYRKDWLRPVAHFASEAWIPVETFDLWRGSYSIRIMGPGDGTSDRRAHHVGQDARSHNFPALCRSEVLIPRTLARPTSSAGDGAAGGATLGGPGRWGRVEAEIEGVAQWERRSAAETVALNAGVEEDGRANLR